MKLKKELKASSTRVLLILTWLSSLLMPGHLAPRPGTTHHRSDSKGARFRRVCYYTNWSQYRKGQGRFLPSDIDPFLCTHIVFAFAKLDHQGHLAPYEWNDIQYPYLYRQFTSLKKKNPDLKTLLAVGGWTLGSDSFSRMVKTKEGRRSFQEHAIQYLRSHNFDGLDLDWEYPANRGSPLEDRDNFSLLLKELREGFEQEAARGGKPRLLLAAAVAGGEKIVRTAYDVPKLDKYLDFISLMSYDLHGSWSKYLGHNAPLYAGNFNTSEAKVTHSVDDSVKLWLGLGASREKLVMGIPFYGRSFTTCKAKVRPGQRNCGVGKAAPYTREKGFVSYYEMEWYLKGGWTRVWLDREKVPYAYNLKTQQWVGYDDTDSIRIKAEYIRNEGLGGAMVWALDLDDFHGFTSGTVYPLANTIRSLLEDAVPSSALPSQTETAENKNNNADARRKAESETSPLAKHFLVPLSERRKHITDNLRKKIKMNLNIKIAKEKKDNNLIKKRFQDGGDLKNKKVTDVMKTIQNPKDFVKKLKGFDNIIDFEEKEVNKRRPDILLNGLSKRLHSLKRMTKKISYWSSPSTVAPQTTATNRELSSKTSRTASPRSANRRLDSTTASKLPNTNVNERRYNHDMITPESKSFPTRSTITTISTILNRAADTDKLGYKSATSTVPVKKTKKASFGFNPYMKFKHLYASNRLSTTTDATTTTILPTNVSFRSILSSTKSPVGRETIPQAYSISVATPAKHGSKQMQASVPAAPTSQAAASFSLTKVMPTNPKQSLNHMKEDYTVESSPNPPESSPLALDLDLVKVADISKDYGSDSISAKSGNANESDKVVKPRRKGSPRIQEKPKRISLVFKHEPVAEETGKNNRCTECVTKEGRAKQHALTTSSFVSFLTTTPRTTATGSATARLSKTAISWILSTSKQRKTSTGLTVKSTTTQPNRSVSISRQTLKSTQHSATPRSFPSTLSTESSLPSRTSSTKTGIPAVVLKKGTQAQTKKTNRNKEEVKTHSTKRKFRSRHSKPAPHADMDSFRRNKNLQATQVSQTKLQKHMKSALTISKTENAATSTTSAPASTSTTLETKILSVNIKAKNLTRNRLNLVRGIHTSRTDPRSLIRANDTYQSPKKNVIEDKNKKLSAVKIERDDMKQKHVQSSVIVNRKDPRKSGSEKSGMRALNQRKLGTTKLVKGISSSPSSQKGATVPTTTTTTGRSSKPSPTTPQSNLQVGSGYTSGKKAGKHVAIFTEHDTLRTTTSVHETRKSNKNFTAILHPLNSMTTGKPLRLKPTWLPNFRDTNTIASESVQTTHPIASNKMPLPIDLSNNITPRPLQDARHPRHRGDMTILQDTFSVEAIQGRSITLSVTFSQPSKPRKARQPFASDAGGLSRQHNATARDKVETATLKNTDREKQHLRETGSANTNRKVAKHTYEPKQHLRGIGSANTNRKVAKHTYEPKQSESNSTTSRKLNKMTVSWVTTPKKVGSKASTSAITPRLHAGKQSSKAGSKPKHQQTMSKLSTATVNMGQRRLVGPSVRQSTTTTSAKRYLSQTPPPASPSTTQHVQGTSPTTPTSPLTVSARRQPTRAPSSRLTHLVSTPHSTQVSPSSSPATQSTRHVPKTTLNKNTTSRAKLVPATQFPASRLSWHHTHPFPPPRRQEEDPIVPTRSKNRRQRPSTHLQEAVGVFGSETHRVMPTHRDDVKWWMNRDTKLNDNKWWRSGQDGKKRAKLFAWNRLPAWTRHTFMTKPLPTQQPKKSAAEDCDTQSDAKFQATGVRTDSLRAALGVRRKVKYPGTAAVLDSIQGQTSPFQSVYRRDHYQELPFRWRQYEFQCHTSFGLYPDPNDCHKFYQCVWLVAFHHSCGAGTVWNDDMKICDWPTASSCLS